MEQRATVEPTRLDVLCGSGHFVLTHPGNVRLRRIIGENFNAYLSAASKPDKSDIVDAIVQEVVHCNGRRSRVLKKDPIFSSWFAVSKNTKKVLRDKITSSLRVMSKSHEEDEATITLHNPDQRQEECSDSFATSVPFEGESTSITCCEHDSVFTLTTDSVTEESNEACPGIYYNSLCFKRENLSPPMMSEQVLPAIRTIQEMTKMPSKLSIGPLSTDD